MFGQSETNARNSDNGSTLTALDREVISCKTCGLVQYRTRTGNCRRCMRLLDPRAMFAWQPALKLRASNHTGPRDLRGCAHRGA